MSVQLPVADNLQLKVEDGFTTTGLVQMSDAGDNQAFNSGGTRFSLCDKDENGINREPIVKPDGLINGCYITPSALGANDAIDISPGAVSIGGATVAVAGITNLTLIRPAIGNFKIISITVDSVGTINAIDGIEGTATSTIRGATGGQPFVPIDSVELGRITFSSSLSAVVTDSEITFSPELSIKPYWDILPYSASIKFKEPLPLIHTGATSKKVLITYAEPQTTSLDVISFTPPSLLFTHDEITGRTATGKKIEGKALLIISPTGIDLAKKIDGTIRLIDFMPDGNGTRHELYFVKISTAITYLPGNLMEGEITLLPIKEPLTII